MDIFNQTTINEISRLLQDEKLTIAVAESCTSGLIQTALSQATHATGFFQGGLTAYNLGQKAKHLRVNPVVAEACNSVSREVSERMALEVAHLFNAEIGIGITGYAKPVPDLSIDDSFAYITINLNSKTVLTKKIKGDPSASLFNNQLTFTHKVLDNLLHVLQEK